jgi:hypothetical protein
MSDTLSPSTSRLISPLLYRSKWASVVAILRPSDTGSRSDRLHGSHPFGILVFGSQGRSLFPVAIVGHLLDVSRAIYLAWCLRVVARLLAANRLLLLPSTCAFIFSPLYWPVAATCVCAPHDHIFVSYVLNLDPSLRPSISS